jgi:hypothetical protein
MHLTNATIVLLQAVNGTPEPVDERVGVVVPFELVAIAVGVLVTFGLVYLVRRALDARK